MIDNIKTVMNELSKVLGLPFVREDQLGDRYKEPFFSYKLNTTIREPFYKQNIVLAEYADQTKMRSLRTAKVTIPVSMTFYHHDFRQLWPIVYSAMDWLDSESGRIVFKSNRLFAVITSDAQDRTVHLDAEISYRFGFDLNFNGTITKESIIDSIDLERTFGEFPA